MRLVTQFLMFFFIFFPLQEYAFAGTNNVEIDASKSTGKETYLGKFYEGENKTAEKKGEATPSVFGVILKAVLVLGILSLIVWGVFKFLFKGTSRPSADDIGVLDVVASKHIGFGNYIQIVKVGGDFYIVGFSNSGGISVMEKIENQDVVNEIKVASSRLKQTSKPVSFWEMVVGHLRGKGANVEERSPLSFLKKQKDRLRKM